MNKNIFKRGASALLAVVMCLTTLVGIGGMTAYAAGTESTAVMIGFPRDGDNNYNGTWGHGYLSFMNGWSASATNYTLVYSGSAGCPPLEGALSADPADPCAAVP